MTWTNENIIIMKLTFRNKFQWNFNNKSARKNKQTENTLENVDGKT